LEPGVNILGFEKKVSKKKKKVTIGYQGAGEKNEGTEIEAVKKKKRGTRSARGDLTATTRKKCEDSLQLGENADRGEQE